MDIDKLELNLQALGNYVWDAFWERPLTYVFAYFLLHFAVAFLKVFNNTNQD